MAHCFGPGPNTSERRRREAQRSAFIHSTRGHEARIHTLPCWFYEKTEAGLSGARWLPQWEHMGRGS